jgi:hypothetical protein
VRVLLCGRTGTPDVLEGWAAGDRFKKKMKDKAKQESDLRDKDEAAEERPVPSQAEGDLETVEEDLKRDEERRKKGNASSGEDERKP